MNILTVDLNARTANVAFNSSSAVGLDTGSPNLPANIALFFTVQSMLPLTSFDIFWAHYELPQLPCGIAAGLVQVQHSSCAAETSARKFLICALQGFSGQTSGGKTRYIHRGTIAGMGNNSHTVKMLVSRSHSKCERGHVEFRFPRKCFHR